MRPSGRRWASATGPRRSVRRASWSDWAACAFIPATTVWPFVWPSGPEPRGRGRGVGWGGMRGHPGDYGVAIRLAFAPEAQGKGYGTELCRAALAFAFDVAKLDRVVALTRSDNLPSQRSLEKCGMVREREIRMASGRVILLYAAFNPNS